nr:hypothetical protein [Blastopirellula marina]
MLRNRFVQTGFGERFAELFGTSEERVDEAAAECEAAFLGNSSPSSVQYAALALVVPTLNFKKVCYPRNASFSEKMLSLGLERQHDENCGESGSLPSRITTRTEHKASYSGGKKDRLKFILTDAATRRYINIIKFASRHMLGVERGHFPGIDV